MFLAVVNKSQLVTQANVSRAVDACASQLKLHVAPAWNMVPASVVLYADETKAPQGSDLLIILDDATQAGALGFHQVTPQGLPYARAFAKPVLDAGGTALQGSMSVSAVMSHEVCEWFADPLLSFWADGPDGEYPLEICDPVQNDAYNMEGVSVSNFVWRPFFDQYAAPGTKLDQMGTVQKPFTTSMGGYLQVRKAGSVQTILGARFPDWLQETKDFPAARSFRRAHPVSPAKS